MTGGFIDGRTLADGATVKADVCVIGSGAGGAVTAAQLATAGFDVLVVEEGGHHTRPEFVMREDVNFPMLYQEAGGRMTKDLALNVLQGRAVGGSTVVNWTTSFRTPDHVYDHWRTQHAVGGITIADLNPHWDAVEQRLNVKKIPYEETNRNNRTLYDGCKALGLAVDTTRRNVKGCMNSGYCGMGCPIDAKMSMLQTYLPDAVAAGARVLSRCRVERLIRDGSAIGGAAGTIIGDDGYNSAGKRITVAARRFVLSAGGIGSPAILIRSGFGGTHHSLVGKQTWLHPVAGVAARWKEPIEPYYGAPQSVASHAHAHRGDDAGVFYEAAPLHPMMATVVLPGIGKWHQERMKQLPFTSAHIALSIDGFHVSEVGGSVSVRPSGAPLLDYPVPPRILEALRFGLKTLARIDFAAGAEELAIGEAPSLTLRSPADIAQIDRYDMTRMPLFSAHVMGGCKMGDDPSRAVVRSSDLRHHTIENLHIVDGSVFPTSLGVNPQLSIYGLAHLVSSRLAHSWKT
ncbi:MAG TPA: GMC family oxidoreductase [Polyangia bacterium]|nr:GMC family oxidoreductase [Polyangia bacterium]